ncbi:5'-methylthioadenosine/S-adenosylhomocysteine nucleosidase [Pseudoflavonifractor sp. An85]|uniref:5'-methylthioadenosine/S-adenosylhomocysteine nucleosidase n=1 Tax=Pseudoflavonifractor sp. An85 TaxID=1965661 RepID=UPI000B383F98|nr:5'-methylthioadenosine/S-adenosylhomocysteine nucleosidase [Pseudoflavonifractor sp. An85]OUN21622.1 hypothetical protein B5G37_11030 [Pseudoflavonifractor sp. An85]
MRGIVYAMGKEMAGPLAQANPLGDVAGMKLYQADETTVVCVCGIGKVHAAMGTQLLIDRFGVDEVYNAGVAGCFHDFPVGTLVVAHHCVQHDMDISATGSPLGEIPGPDLIELLCTGTQKDVDTLTQAGFAPRTGVVATGDWFGRDYTRAAMLRDHFSATVCDMEAGAVAQVCLCHHIPFHSLKIVSDHLFHPAQGEEYAQNVPQVVEKLNQALAALLWRS